MAVTVSNLTKKFQSGTEAIAAVRKVSFSVEHGAFLTLLGPSGCGKTTTLRCLAGLEQPEEGEIVLEDQTVFSGDKGINLPVNQRPIGMVFQSYAIWPHMTVFHNVAYPLKAMGLPKGEIRSRVEKTLALVGLEGFSERLSPHLSGGQQQRVALARALVMEPKVLLLDEPLSNLDAKLRESMRGEISRLQRQLGITTVYVTHDQVEALCMSDIVAVMEGGRIVEFDTPRGIYERPKSRFGAEFIGTANLIRGRRIERERDGFGRSETEVGPLSHTLPLSSGSLPEALDFLVRPEDVKLLSRPEVSRANQWPGEVTQVTFLGPYLDCEVVVNGVRLRARVPRSQELKAGDRVYVSVDPGSCNPLFPRTKP